MTAASRATNPSDNIVTDVQSQKDVDFSHVTKEIEDYHRSHPKSFQQELGRINEAFQNNPTLHAAIPDLTIVVAKGQDLTFKDKDGHFVTVDSRNINRRTMAPQSPEIQDFGRTGSADMMPDGSGRFTVPKHGRVDGWDMAREVLKSQTGQEPSLNEIGNYLVEAKRLNPHTNFNRPLKSGSTIDLPSITRQGDETTFGDQRSVDDQQHA